VRGKSTIDFLHQFIRKAFAAMMTTGSRPWARALSNLRSAGVKMSTLHGEIEQQAVAPPAHHRFHVRRRGKRAIAPGRAFKLLEIDDKEKLLRPGATVVDLGSAPGGWSQVAAARVRPGGSVTAIDLIEMAPVPGVVFQKGDFRALVFDGRADVVLSDISPNISGIRDADQARVAELIEEAAALAGRSSSRAAHSWSKRFTAGAFRRCSRE